MEVTAYSRIAPRISRIKNKRPAYIPNKEDIDRLVEYTRKPREYPQSMPIATGKKYDYENKIRFIINGKVGEPCISKEDLSAYLLYLLKTTEPANTEDKEKLQYIKETMEQLLMEV